ncbi:MAG: imelysin family protein [Hoeflea sp.]|uniref:imelysin family protein n=1 Tax=Hoeflea sp. TaxID=1940281 RepID=UPI0032EEACB8
MPLLSRTRIVFATVLAGALLPVAGFSADLEATGVLKDTLKDYVRPAYSELQDNFRALEQRTEMLCRSPSEQALGKVRNAFEDAAMAWAGIEWFRTGPAMSDNRLERVLFYPDRKSTGLKQVRRAMRTEDADVTSKDTLSRQSVAMQGLGAVEFLVFGKDADRLADGAAGFRCAYAMTVASNLAGIALELSEGWADDEKLSALFVAPASDNPLFRDDVEALNLVLGTIIHGLEAIRDIRIGGFLREPGNDRTVSALYRYSGLTMQSVAANLEGLERLFNRSGIERVLPDGEADLADQVRFEFNQSIRTARSLEGNLDDLVAEETTRRKLVYLQNSIRYTIKRLNDEIAPAAGLAAGFSFGDGD